MSKPKVHIDYSKSGDWYEVFINGVKEFEGHSISGIRLGYLLSDYIEFSTKQQDYEGYGT